MLVFIHALSPLHVGIGHSPGAIDLPIARDKASGFPIVPGSGLKGALRAHTSSIPGREVIKVFGPETTNASDHAGGIHFGDAHLLALPVRSIAGTFAWVTSPYLLQRFARDAIESGVVRSDIPPIPKLEDREKARLAHAETIAWLDGKELKVVLEDLDLKPNEDAQAKAWSELIAKHALEASWGTFFQKRFLVVHDDIMRYLSVHGVDVTSRNRLENDTKTVADGALWTEESLPTESLLCAFAAIVPNNGTLPQAGLEAALQALNGETLHIGGKTTVGRGRCRIAIGGRR